MYTYMYMVKVWIGMVCVRQGFIWGMGVVGGWERGYPPNNMLPRGGRGGGSMDDHRRYNMNCLTQSVMFPGISHPNVKSPPPPPHALY